VQQESFAVTHRRCAHQSFTTSRRWNIRSRPLLHERIVAFFSGCSCSLSTAVRRAVRLSRREQHVRRPTSYGDCLSVGGASARVDGHTADPEIVSSQSEVIAYVNYTGKLSCLIHNRQREHVTHVLTIRLVDERACRLGDLVSRSPSQRHAEVDQSSLC
jgi:hypothetical protein